MSGRSLRLESVRQRGTDGRVRVRQVAVVVFEIFIGRGGAAALFLSARVVFVESAIGLTGQASDMPIPRATPRTGSTH